MFDGHIVSLFFLFYSMPGHWAKTLTQLKESLREYDTVIVSYFPRQCIKRTTLSFTAAFDDFL